MAVTYHQTFGYYQAHAPTEDCYIVRFVQVIELFDLCFSLLLQEIKEDYKQSSLLFFRILVKQIDCFANKFICIMLYVHFSNSTWLNK